MAILSFKLTKEEFLTGKKTVTRRDWKRPYMEKWQRWYDEGRRVHDAYDQIPIAGGEKFGEFRLTCRPYWEKLEDMPEEDLEALFISTGGGRAHNYEQQARARMDRPGWFSLMVVSIAGCGALATCITNGERAVKETGLLLQLLGLLTIAIGLGLTRRFFGHQPWWLLPVEWINSVELLRS